MYEGLSDKEKEIASPRPFFPKKGVIMNYVARFFKDGDGIGVEFPDVPGAFTCADSMEEAKQMAKECQVKDIIGISYKQPAIVNTAINAHYIGLSETHRVGKN